MKTSPALLKAFFFLIGFLFASTSYSQSNFLPGYIIKLNGDTLHGVIDYRNWEKSPTKIVFKENESGTKSEFSATEISGFSVADELYESAIIETEVSTEVIGELTTDAELKFQTDTAFLQTMIKGKKSLYYYKNHLEKEQFYIKTEQGYELLIYKKFLTETKYKTDLSENRKFLSQLSTYLQDCTTVQQKSEHTEYKKRSIEKLFIYYYTCTNAPVLFQKKTEKIAVKTGVVGGLSLNSLSFSGKLFPYLAGTDYKSTMSFAAGMSFEFIKPRSAGKWSLYNELLFTSYKFSGVFTDFENENEYTITSTTLGYSYIKANTLLRFRRPVGKQWVYFNAGMSNGYALSEKNHKKIESKFYSTTTIKEEKAVLYSRKYEQGFVAGLGTIINRLSVEARFERGNGMAGYKELSSIVSRYYLMIGFKL